MAVTERQRRRAYDNISKGSATGQERTIAGSSTSPIEIYGGGRVTSTSNEVAANPMHTNIASGTSTSNSVIENIVGGTAGYAGENI